MMEDVLNGNVGCQGVSRTSRSAIQYKLFRPMINSLQATMSCELSMQIPSDCTTTDFLCECFCAIIRPCGFNVALELPGYALITTPKDVMKVSLSLPES